MNAAVDAQDNIKRFRAVIQHLNIQFSKNMTFRGHKYTIPAGPGDDDAEQAEERKAQQELIMLAANDISPLPKPRHISREEAIAWVKSTLERSRGYELPGTFQPMLISQLFWEQSEPWKCIAAEHISRVADVCKDFVYKVLEYTAPTDCVPRIISMKVDAALEEARVAAQEELAKILKDKLRHPMTYNRKSRAL